MTGVHPRILADSGNLIVHLEPHRIVARMPYRLQTSGSVQKSLTREIQVARHLHEVGVPTVEPATVVDAGPYLLGADWLALWTYAEPATLAALPGPEVVALVLRLTAGLKTYSGFLPTLGAWGHASAVLPWLEQRSEPSCEWLYRRLIDADLYIRSLPTECLVPSHGDSHRGNLLATARGWVWGDFEDVGLMPEWWDLASAVANSALLEGADDPSVAYAFARAAGARDVAAFARTLWARCVWATATNLYLARRGHGDDVWAQRQMDSLPRLNERVRTFL